MSGTFFGTILITRTETQHIMSQHMFLRKKVPPFPTNPKKREEFSIGYSLGNPIREGEVKPFRQHSNPQENRQFQPCIVMIYNEI